MGIDGKRTFLHDAGISRSGGADAFALSATLYDAEEEPVGSGKIGAAEESCSRAHRTLAPVRGFWVAVRTT
jgi:hypothetical protein